MQLNTGQTIVSGGYPDYSGKDLKVERAWIQGVTGCGVTTAIVDDGNRNNHSQYDCIYIGDHDQQS